VRICLISNGKSEHIHRLSNYLISLNHEVHLISGRTRESFSTQVIMHPLFDNPLAWPLQVKHLVRHIHPDVVDGHYASIYGYLAAFSHFRPLVVTVWGSDLFIQPWHNKIWKYTTRYALNQATVINCWFPMEVADPALRKLKVDITKVNNYLLGVDAEIFKPLGFNSNLAKSMDIQPNTPVVINVRGFAPVYDFETYFRSIPLILEKVPKAKFIALHKKGQREIGESLAKQLGISQNVVLVEWVPQSDMPKLLSLASVYVSTSISDGASNALFEAMACEVAIVVTDIPANRYWVNDGENGYLFKSGEYTILAEKIICLLKDKEKRESFGKKCREIILRKANQKVELAKIENSYRDLVEKYNKSNLK
jgi:glycosyltransferase involved in cell wall biosynthesis